MNDDPTPLTDEQLSAAIDGEADDATLARIEADPEARARRDELAAAAARFGEPVAPLSSAQVDDLVAAALDAPAPVATLRPRRRRGPQPWLVAAAVVLLVAIGGAMVLGVGGDGENQDMASTAADSTGGQAADASAELSLPDHGAGSSAGETDAAEMAPEDGAAATTAAPSGGDANQRALTPDQVVDLGEFTDADALREALAAAFPNANQQLDTGATTTSGDAIGADALERCAEQMKITLNLEEDATRVGSARVGDKPVLAYEFPSASYVDGTPTTLVVAVGVTACDQVVIFER